MDTIVQTLVQLMEHIDTADDSEIDCDFAVKILEESSSNLMRMEQVEKDLFRASIERLTALAIGKRKEFLSNFMSNANLGDS